MVTCCFSCNQKKGSKPLDQCGLTLRSFPKKPTVNDLMVQDLHKIGVLPEDWIPYLPHLNVTS